MKILKTASAFGTALLMLSVSFIPAIAQTPSAPTLVTVSLQFEHNGARTTYDQVSLAGQKGRHWINFFHLGLPDLAFQQFMFGYGLNVLPANWTKAQLIPSVYGNIVTDDGLHNIYVMPSIILTWNAAFNPDSSRIAAIVFYQDYRAITDYKNGSREVKHHQSVLDRAQASVNVYRFSDKISIWLGGSYYRYDHFGFDQVLYRTGIVTSLSTPIGIFEIFGDLRVKNLDDSIERQWLGKWSYTF